MRPEATASPRLAIGAGVPLTAIVSGLASGGVRCSGSATRRWTARPKLRGVAFFEGFTDAELDRVAALADDVEAEAGAVLIEQGRVGTGVLRHPRGPRQRVRGRRARGRLGSRVDGGGDGAGRAPPPGGHAWSPRRRCGSSPSTPHGSGPSRRDAEGRGAGQTTAGRPHPGQHRSPTERSSPAASGRPSDRPVPRGERQSSRVVGVAVCRRPDQLLGLDGRQQVGVGRRRTTSGRPSGVRAATTRTRRALPVVQARWRSRR